MAEITGIETAYHWSISRFAEAFKMDRATIRKRLKAAGVEPVGHKGASKLYALKDAAPAICQADQAAEFDIPDDPEKMPPNMRKDWYAGEKDRLATDTTKGQLVPVVEHREANLVVLKSVVGFFEGLTDKMERTRKFTVEQLEELESCTDDMRADLYDKLQQAEGVARADG
ncbi:DUF1441 family protein [Pontibacterium sp.]|uniref:DUF1441 family protein n=1 Tax=Pontibacterium sp. TaxID=2036026 RepID=UPI00356B6107